MRQESFAAYIGVVLSRNSARPTPNRTDIAANRIVQPEVKEGPPTSPIGSFGKRACDLVIAIAALLLLSPLMLLVCLLIRLDSRGPIIIGKRRLDFDGQAFAAYGFRTSAQLGEEPKFGQGRCDSPRLNAVGHILMQSGIDEIPQLFNVIRGEMSLVGPRPRDAVQSDDCRRPASARAIPRQVKPGITGWAQINGQRGDSRHFRETEKIVELDLWYIENWTLMLDFKILGRALFEMRGEDY